MKASYKLLKYKYFLFIFNQKRNAFENQRHIIVRFFFFLRIILNRKEEIFP